MDSTRCLKKQIRSIRLLSLLHVLQHGLSCLFQNLIIVWSLLQRSVSKASPCCTNFTPSAITHLGGSNVRAHRILVGEQCLGSYRTLLDKCIDVSGVAVSGIACLHRFQIEDTFVVLLALKRGSSTKSSGENSLADIGIRSKNIVGLKCPGRKMQ
jgi:hypothetical protein